jgi:6-pyruvoyl-tetrahydropterin synthase
MVPFDRVKEVIDKYDHALILYVWDPLVQLATQEVVVVTVPDAPTTENLAHEIVQDIADLVRGPAEREVTVVLQETDNIQAVATLVTSAEREEV